MDEYIEREAALALLKNDREVCADSKEELKYIRADIRSIPAADVRPVVRGKWESHGEGFKWVYICSACGYVDGYPLNDRMNFCPNCGADMRLDDETT